MTDEELVLPGGLRVPHDEVTVQVSRSSGPGGQHVNRTESRVTLRFNVQDSPSLTDAARERLLERLGSRLTRAGEVLVSCEKHRDQRRNREEAFAVLERLLVRALERPRPRRPTRPTRASVRRRLDRKRRQGDRKRTRGRPGAEE